MALGLLLLGVPGALPRSKGSIGGYPNGERALPPIKVLRNKKDLLDAIYRIDPYDYPDIKVELSDEQASS